MNRDRVLFVINPQAGGGKTRKIWSEKIYPLIKSSKIPFDYSFTKKPYDGFNLSMNGIKEGYKKIISIGGDGTANEIVNAIMKQNFVDTTDIAVTAIGTGSGNDWRKTVGIPENLEDIIKLLEKDNFILQDVGLVTYTQKKREKSRYFINVAGMGFDAEVTYKANKSKKRFFGKLSYSLILFLTLFSFKDPYIQIRVNDKIVYQGALLTLNVGIGKYSGGGMMFTPNAIYDDGLFDITAVDKISFFSIIKNLKKIYDGSFINHKAVKTFIGKTVEIESRDKLYLEVDGESLGHSPLHFEILPKKLKVLSVKK